MRKNYLFFISFLIALILSVGCDRRSAENERKRPPFRHPHEDALLRVERMADDLDLSPEQLEKLKVLEREINEKRIEMRRERKNETNIKEKIIDMVRKDSLSRDKITAFMDELNSLKEKYRKETDSFVAERLAKMHSILTEEQREKLARKLEEFKPRPRFRPREDSE